MIDPSREPQPKKVVRRIDQSPMNPLIWVLELECGHDIYITRKSRPSNMRTFTDKATGEKMTDYRREHCAKCHQESQS